jgi:broad specificity phosphatase PhoE
MLTLVLTRHGITSRSVPEQHLGQRIDVGLSAAGRSQARALGRRLVGVRFERIVSSPLLRARQTAAIVRAALPQAPQLELDARLQEMDYGAWEGLTYDQVDEGDPALRARWEVDPAANACPGGESGDDVAWRATAFLVDLIAWHDGRHGAGSADERPVLAVAHSTLDRVLICVATAIPVREYRRRFSQDQANLTVLRFEHGDGPSDARIVLLNDTAHLRSPGARPWG